MALRSSLTMKIDQHSAGGKRLQSAVQEKLKEYMGPDYSDEVLPLYIVVMLSHGNPQPLVAENLDAFLNVNATGFAAWLFEHVAANEELYRAEETQEDPTQPAAASSGEADMTDAEALMEAGSPDGSGDHAIDEADRRGGVAPAAEPISRPANTSAQNKMEFEDGQARVLADRRDRERRDRDRDRHETDRRHGAAERSRGDAWNEEPPSTRLRGHDERQHHDSRDRPDATGHRYDSRRRSPPRQRRTRSRSPSRHPWEHQQYQDRAYPRGHVNGWQADAGQYWREWAPYPPPDWRRDGYYPQQRWGREPWPADRHDGRPYGHLERGPAARRGERDDDRRRAAGWDARWDLEDRHIAHAEGSPVPPAVDFEARARDTGRRYAPPPRIAMAGPRHEPPANSGSERHRPTEPAAIVDAGTASDPDRQVTEGRQPSSVFQRLAAGGEMEPASDARHRQRSVWERLQTPVPEAAPGPEGQIRDPQDATDGTELLGLQDVLRRMESELAQLRMAAWTQHKAQTQIQSMRFRTNAERAAVSVVLSNLHFKASKSVVAAHFSVAGPVVKVTILRNRLTRRARGRAYVEFADNAAAGKALTLSGSILMQRPVKVETISPKPLQWTPRWTRATVFSNKPPRLVELTPA